MQHARQAKLLGAVALLLIVLSTACAFARVNYQGSQEAPSAVAISRQSVALPEADMRACRKSATDFSENDECPGQVGPDDDVIVKTVQDVLGPSAEQKELAPQSVPPPGSFIRLCYSPASRAIVHTVVESNIFPNTPTVAGGYIGELGDIVRRRSRQGAALFCYTEAIAGRYPTEESIQEFASEFVKAVLDGGSEHLRITPNELSMRSLLRRLLDAHAIDPLNPARTDFLDFADENSESFVRDILLNLIELRGIDPLAKRAVVRALENLAANHRGTHTAEEGTGTYFVNELFEYFSGPASIP